MFYNASAPAFMADFETTVYSGQTETEVWAAAICALSCCDPEEVILFGNLTAFMEHLKSLTGISDIVVFFHNLKFDGSFILDWLERNPQYHSKFELEWIKDDLYIENEYSYLISDMGQWYNLVICWNGHRCYIMDSFKLLPMSVKSIGTSFKTCHQKTEIEYTGYRYADCPISEEEQRYIKNDVLVVAEALHMLRSQGHLKSTIGSCCLAEYKHIIRHEHMVKWTKFFPDLTAIELDESYGAENADAYIRKAYRGGWCYLKPDKADCKIENGHTYDVNSLYPSMMHSESGNLYPIGLPTFFKGDLPKEAVEPLRFYFVRLECMFNLKKGMLPFVQMKHNSFYFGNEMLTTSDLFYNGSYHRYYIDEDGNKKIVKCVITMAQTEFELFLKHYNTEFKILDGCWFSGMRGIFDLYINKYAKIKQESKHGKRLLAKLFLNNLYGRLGTNPDSSYKIARIDEEGNLKFRTVLEKEKTPVYIPCAAAITAYARRFTIEAAQKNYDHFIYADTDSIHCMLPPDQVKGMKLDPSAFQCWDHESEWEYGIFHRQKTYIEKTKDDYIIKCAGLPDRCKELFIASVEKKPFKCRSEAEEAFLKEEHKITDFKEGLEIPGKLTAQRIRGGIILKDDIYTIRG